MGARARASGPNAAAHVTRGPSLLRNRLSRQRPAQRTSGGCRLTFRTLGDQVPLSPARIRGVGLSSSTSDEEARLGLAPAGEGRAKDETGQGVLSPSLGRGGRGREGPGSRGAPPTALLLP